MESELYAQQQGQSGKAIGIDLGTTFCCLAIRRDNNRTEIIPNDLGVNKTPSYIAFPNLDEQEEKGVDDDDDDHDDDDDEPYYGETAQMLAHENPLYTIFDVKRMLGRKYNDPRIQRDMKFWPFQVQDSEGQLKVKTGRDTTCSPVQLTSALLKHLLKLAGTYLGYPITNAVIAVPAYYNSNQRQLIREACEQASLNVLQLISEPTAAAVAYNIQKRPSKETSSRPTNCLIFDFGGGTFDVAVLRIDSNQIEVKAIGGDDHLGGEDVDNNMVDYCLQQFKQKHGIDLIEKRNSASKEDALKISNRLRRLKLECEKQKRFLTQTGQQVISLDAMHQAIPLVVQMSRQTFDSINMELFNKCITVMGQVLQKSKIDKKEVDEVVLVGGSSRIPKMQEMVSEFFDGKQLCLSIDADEAVAVGAAILASGTEQFEVPNMLIEELEYKSDNELLHLECESQLTGEVNQICVRDIGIYINQDTIQIGSYTQTDKQRMDSCGSYSKLISIIPEIFFSDDEILIGHEARNCLYYNRNHNIKRHFNIFELITSTKIQLTHFFTIKRLPYKLCSHQIVALFFQKAFESIQLVPGGQVVITIPFSKTATVADRIRNSLRIVGYCDKNILVYSTLLTMTIGTLEKTNQEDQSAPESFGKSTFCVDIQKDSFSLGIVSINGRSILGDALCYSDDVDIQQQFKDEYFVKFHHYIYNGFEILDFEKSKIEDIYQAAINKRFDFYLWKMEVTKMVSACDNPTVVVELVQQLLEKDSWKVKGVDVVNPLLGASLLASTMSRAVVNILPPPQEIRIEDFGWQNCALLLCTNFEGIEEQKPITYSATFTFPIQKISDVQRDYSVKLFCKQRYSNDDIWEACRYKLTLQRRTNPLFNSRWQKLTYSSTVSVRILIDFHLDGLLRLQTENMSENQLELKMERLDMVTCSEAPGCDTLELQQLMEYYEYSL